MKTDADSFFDFDIEPIRMRYLGSSSKRKTKQNQKFFSHFSWINKFETEVFRHFIQKCFEPCPLPYPYLTLTLFCFPKKAFFGGIFCCCWKKFFKVNFGNHLSTSQLRCQSLRDFKNIVSSLRLSVIRSSSSLKEKEANVD